MAETQIMTETSIVLKLFLLGEIFFPRYSDQALQWHNFTGLFMSFYIWTHFSYVQVNVRIAYVVQCSKHFMWFNTKNVIIHYSIKYCNGTLKYIAITNLIQQNTEVLVKFTLQADTKPQSQLLSIWPICLYMRNCWAFLLYILFVLLHWGICYFIHNQYLYKYLCLKKAAFWLLFWFF